VTLRGQDIGGRFRGPPAWRASAMPGRKTTVVSIREEFVLKALETQANLARCAVNSECAARPATSGSSATEQRRARAARPVPPAADQSTGREPEVIVDLVAIATPIGWGARNLIWDSSRADRSIPSRAHGEWIWSAAG